MTSRKQQKNPQRQQRQQQRQRQRQLRQRQKDVATSGWRWMLFLLVNVVLLVPKLVTAECEITTETELKPFQTKIFVELVGIPELLTPQDVQDFQEAMQEALSCSNAVDDSRIEITNVVVDGSDTFEYVTSSSDSTGSSSSTNNSTSAATTTITSSTETDGTNGTATDGSTDGSVKYFDRTWMWSVSIEGLTNLESISDYRFLSASTRRRRTKAETTTTTINDSNSNSNINSNRKEPEASTFEYALRQLQDDDVCACTSQLTADNLVSMIRTSLSGSAAAATGAGTATATSPSSGGGSGNSGGLKDIVMMLEAEPKAPCPVDITMFTSNIGLQVVGNIDLVTDESLKAIAETFQLTFNELNGIVNCDLTFRSLTRAFALIDPFSIELGGGGGGGDAGGDGDVPPTADGSDSGGMRTRLRRVEDVPMIRNTTTAAATTTTTTTTIISNDTSTTSSPSLSSTPTMMGSGSPSLYPTTAPTTRGPDLFTILIQLEGECKGCSSEQLLFNQVNQGQRKTTDMTGNEMEADSEVMFGNIRTNLDGRKGRKLEEEGCFCPVGVSESDLSQDTFVKTWEENLEKKKEEEEEAGNDQDESDAEENGTEDGEDAVGDGGGSSLGGDLGFYNEATALEEFRIFDCTEDKDELIGLAIAEFAGDLSMLTQGEIAVIEANFLQTFNTLTEESCDPYLRRLSSVRTLSVGLKTEVPSTSPTMTRLPTSHPTESTSPTSAPTVMLGRRSLFRKGKSVPNHREALLEEEGLSSRNETVGLNATNSSSSSFPLSSLSPTESPTTRGADLFLIEFQVTGTCNQCGSGISFFDDIITRDRQRRRGMERRGHLAGGVRLLQGDGIGSDNSNSNPNTNMDRNSSSVGSSTCGCPVAQEEGGVYLYDFLDSFEEAIEESEVESVTEFVGVEEIPEEPSSMPSVVPSMSMMPSMMATTNSSEVLMNASDIMDVNMSMPSMMPSLYSNWNGTSTAPSYNMSDILERNSSAPSLEPSLGLNSSMPSMVVSLVPSAGPSSKPSSIPSVAPSVVPSSIPSVVPSTDPSSVPSEGPSSFPSEGPSSFPSSFPSNFPSLFPSAVPTVFPSSLPSGNPSSVPSVVPSEKPSVAPSVLPSLRPSIVPSEVPSMKPSLSPSQNPSKAPSIGPSSLPSEVPSQMPSLVPSEVPSKLPSQTPSEIPSQTLSEAPSGSPSFPPTFPPSSGPSFRPSYSPSIFPSITPSSLPSVRPTESLFPSFVPSQSPSLIPSFSPSLFPSPFPSPVTARPFKMTFTVTIRCTGEDKDGTVVLSSGRVCANFFNYGGGGCMIELKCGSDYPLRFEIYTFQSSLSGVVLQADLGFDPFLVMRAEYEVLETATGSRVSYGVLFDVSSEDLDVGICMSTGVNSESSAWGKCGNVCSDRARFFTANEDLYSCPRERRRLSIFGKSVGDLETTGETCAKFYDSDDNFLVKKCLESVSSTSASEEYEVMVGAASVGFVRYSTTSDDEVLINEAKYFIDQTEYPALEPINVASATSTVAALCISSVETGAETIGKCGNKCHETIILGNSIATYSCPITTKSISVEGIGLDPGPSSSVTCMALLRSDSVLSRTCKSSFTYTPNAPNIYTMAYDSSAIVEKIRFLMKEPNQGQIFDDLLIKKVEYTDAPAARGNTLFDTTIFADNKGICVSVKGTELDSTWNKCGNSCTKSFELQVDQSLTSCENVVLP